MDRADVLVIGASPAGMACTLECARLGLATVLVDSKRPDYVPSPANTVFEAMAKKAHMPLEPHLVRRWLKGMVIRSPSGRGIRVDARGCVLHRDRLDAHYIEEAERRGARVLWQHRAERLVVSDGIVEGAVVNGEPMRAAITVVACGVDCGLARLAGISPMRHPHDLAWALEAHVVGEGVGEPEYFEYTVGSVAPGWKATYTPLGGDEATIGVYVRRHGRDVSAFFERHLTRFEAEHGPVRVLSVAKGADPVATLPHELVCGGLMVCGGVCGQSGIAYGIRAGTLAAQTAAEALDKGDVSAAMLRAYVRRWRRELWWEHVVGRLSLEMLRRMRDEEIDALVAALEDYDTSRLRGHPLLKLAGVGMHVVRKSPLLALTLLRKISQGMT
ncbi:NAD(P)/FAD-dependent oxidoreductase [Methermicoccus shengliensis]|uniref:NAD(P)/FAD-dependent oxidoreductase n=1 Tax=Methermicoccus shengliensis TaxID=660064 RepID=A0A832RUE8_9EURY|nr:NAD(P)/FAD-dependent oxidoreductase [Methermicoccus shengliensis]KUK04380.1 MAG: Fumarate reductase/succinate dehydrogenase flavoprotein domain protein [Euryarchaeota archaeon 55_53]KUK30191.1 MAG: Fumarate reductase/succinate dehydrogenase flavoprotein domain protein [Methanosarcinales archeaon 56_1174]MDI3488445.1 digeranylgeranylglycerophospholipid reductase [Methanosarcinales archaeon]MDN5295751.1 digeranylgeranylglycerophospholipid reductase [Methanosarcinales archaeon]HIH69030.1 NAD(P